MRKGLEVYRTVIKCPACETPLKVLIESRRTFEHIQLRAEEPKEPKREVHR